MPSSYGAAARGAFVSFLHKTLSPLIGAMFSNLLSVSAIRLDLEALRFCSNPTTEHNRLPFQPTITESSKSPFRLMATKYSNFPFQPQEFSRQERYRLRPDLY